jgi:ketosteroid isomerase-like protein
VSFIDLLKIEEGSMKRFAFAVSVAGLVLAVAVSALTPEHQYIIKKSVNVEQELIKLGNELNEAWINRDIAPFDRALADDYLGTDEEGNVMTKAEQLAKIKAGAYLSTFAVKDDIKVRVYGDSAVVTGRSTHKGQYKGKAFSQGYRWTDTWVKDYLGRRRLVASHDSNIARRINVEADVSAIKALLAEWVQLYNAGDFEKLVSVFYSENAILIAPDRPVRKRKEAILLGYQKYDELNKEHVDSSVAEEVRVSGNLAAAWGVDTGTSTPRRGGEPVKYRVNWLMAFERQPDKTWKCLDEMWNDNPLTDISFFYLLNPIFLSTCSALSDCGASPGK